MNVVVNNDRDYELLIDRKGLASIENVLLQRYQMYRDVYLSPVSVLGDFIFNENWLRADARQALCALPYIKDKCCLLYFRVMKVGGQHFLGAFI